MLPEINSQDYESATPMKLDALLKRKIPRQLRPFLRGPIPIWWLAKAAGLPGRTLAVGLALWYRKGITNMDTVKPSWKLWATLGIGRHAAYRGLANLEAAGLVAIDRRVGRNPLVTIRTVPPDAANAVEQ